MRCADSYLLHEFSGICLVVCGIYVRRVGRGGYFLLNDFFDKPSASPAVDGGRSMGSCSGSGMSGSSIIF